MEHEVDMVDPQEALRALQERLNTAEQELTVERARRAYYETILANVNDAIIIVDTTSRVVEWNAAAERIYGWAAHEVQGRNLGVIVANRYLDGSTNVEAAATLARHGVWTGLVAHRHRDGHEVLIESAVRHLRDGAGQVIGLVGINRDVTTRVAAEEAVRRSEANLRAFFESAPEAHYLLDRDYRILAFNHVTAEQIRAIWGREVAEGDSILPYVNPSNREAFIHYYQCCLRGEANRYERMITYPSGQASWYELSYTPVVQGSGGAVIGVAFSGLDITARKQVELALAQREAQFAGIIDSAMDAIITVDEDHRIVLFNRAAEEIFGCAASEVLGEPLDRFIPSEVHAAHQQSSSALGQMGVTRRSMHVPGVPEGVRADGTRFPIEASISHIRIGEQTFYTAILRDITQRKALETQLLQAQKMESVGRLAGGVAHDFNNLLTVIQGVTDLVRAELPADHAVQADLVQVSSAAQRATILTRRLLTFARQQILAPHVVDLNALVDETAPLLHRLISKDIEVILDLLPEPLPIRADPNQIQQLLMNLAVNARDAMPDGGLLRISTRRAALPRVELGETTTRASPIVRVLVQDTGIGMPPEVQTRIFEPFFTTKPVGQGTGLGLAMCYGIVTQHGGRIEVSSRIGEGSTFTIELPGVDEHVEAIRPGSVAADMPQGSETILLVEDEAPVRVFAERVLRSLGYTVLTAENGLDAFQLATEGTPFDLLLTDVVMPELDGPTLAAQLAARIPGLKVIYMSGYTDHTMLTGKLAAHAIVLQKPFRQGDLAQLVRVVLDQEG